MKRFTVKLSKSFFKHLSAIFILLAIFSSGNSNGQSTASIQGSKPGSATSVEDTLVELALNGPLFRGAVSQNKITEYQLKAAKNQWVNLLTLSANFNNQNNLVQNQPNSVLYPGFNFGITVPLGTILSRTSVKAAREQIEINKTNQEQLARNIRAEILSKYRQYKNYANQIVIQSQNVDDEETAYLQAKEKFRNGLIPIDAFNTAQKTYNSELIKKSDLQLQQDLLKIDIERIIGTTLDSIVNK